MKGNGRNGLVGGIAIFEDLRRVQGLGTGVELGVDPVGHDALRQWLAVRRIDRGHLTSRRGQGKEQGADGAENSDSARNCREGMRHSRSFLRRNDGERPELGAQEPSQITAVVAEHKAAAEQRGGVVRQGAHRKPGHTTEGSIEQADDPAGKISREGIPGNGELRDDPLRAGAKMGKNTIEELLQLMRIKQSRKKWETIRS